MKYIFLTLLLLIQLQAANESKQLKFQHPLQSTKESQKILQAMQENIQTYLYQTPLSSYEYFDKKSSSLKSDPIITWIHGDMYIQTLGVTQDPYIRATLNNEKDTHLGDYRYDIFTLLSDLLLKMQEDSDFSGSKEKAILGTFFDGYFLHIQKPSMQCPCIDDALIEVNTNNLLREYTKITNHKRHFRSISKSLSIPSKKQVFSLKKEMNSYLKKFELLPIKDLVINEFGDYLLLCEGKTKNLDDDIIFTASIATLPISYRVNAKMKHSYLNKSLLSKTKVVSSFNQTNYAGTIKVKNKSFFVNKLNPLFKLKPDSEKTRAYKNYASALGYMLASFHSNPDLKTCAKFSTQINKHVKQRLLKTELISMVYSYNQTLEEKWEDFSSEELARLD